ncbi:MAG: tRNA pseudouridine(38-40) synthase TruA [Lachnospiraceae bacterium]|nr:tRNA pseudouridine(38-40) synthase TruA [Lachnospiraceae bacterium]
MKRVMLRVAYDGTEYCGWQVQPNGITIEEVLNRQLTRITGTEVAVIGASRTDSGVHAKGNVCVFDTESRIPAEKFAFALNAGLPQDVVVQNSCEVAADFHPRHCDCHKTYEYRIYNATFPDPLLRRYSHFLYHKLDVEAMRQAAQYLVGEHDFKSFCSVNTQVKDTVRRVNSIEVLAEPRQTAAEEDAKLITIRINGNGFLYNMVRIIAGTLIQVGFHRYPPEQVATILAAKDRAAAGETAPACGLTLIEICYQESDYRKGSEE